MVALGVILIISDYVIFTPYCRPGILFYCISPTERHAKCLEIAVENGADPNNISAEGIPVLLYACETATDNEEACIQLLQKGANPNGKQDVIKSFDFSFMKY
jgi:hypothetical protein